MDLIRQDESIRIERKTVLASPELDIYRYVITTYHDGFQRITSEYRVGKDSRNYMSSDRHTNAKSVYRQWKAMTSVF